MRICKRSIEKTKLLAHTLTHSHTKPWTTTAIFHGIYRSIDNISLGWNQEISDMLRKSIQRTSYIILDQTEYMTIKTFVFNKFFIFLFLFIVVFFFFCQMVCMCVCVCGLMQKSGNQEAIFFPIFFLHFNEIFLFFFYLYFI